MINIFRFISRPVSFCYILSFYLAVAVFFAACYHFILPAAVGTPVLVHNIQTAGVNINVNFIDCLYFSITSQTTVGFGDIIPVTTGSRILIMVQVLFGYFYLGLAVAFFTARFILRSKKFEAVIRRLKNENELH